ncbi:hypothetical protein ACFWAY_14655 [Rhodococcus sp. NPDC059968]|uniref:hypothetical protein n=1 Tax=Rhodococcus sp. NPDC059968 TaxID=3347017 RepID=UPI00366C406E
MGGAVLGHLLDRARADGFDALFVRTKPDSAAVHRLTGALEWISSAMALKSPPGSTSRHSRRPSFPAPGGDMAVSATVPTEPSVSVCSGWPGAGWQDRCRRRDRVWDGDADQPSGVRSRHCGRFHIPG